MKIACFGGPPAMNGSIRQMRVFRMQKSMLEGSFEPEHAGKLLQMQG